MLYINDLPDGLKNIVKLFADDTKLLSICNNADESKKLQEDLDYFYSWSATWLMKFNAEKCEVIHYGSNNQEFEYKLLNANGYHKLKKSECVRDLGVMFDKDLRMKEQFASVINKANSALK